MYSISLHFYRFPSLVPCLGPHPVQKLICQKYLNYSNSALHSEGCNFVPYSIKVFLKQQKHYIRWLCLALIELLVARLLHLYLPPSPHVKLWGHVRFIASVCRFFKHLFEIEVLNVRLSVKKNHNWHSDITGFCCTLC